MRLFFIGIVSIFFSALSASAQSTLEQVNPPLKVGIFAPLYLDSVFQDGLLKNEKTIPKFIMPAVDFVQGAQIALDTLNIGERKVEAYVFDSKSITTPLKQLIQQGKLDDLDLIIGSVKEPEYTMLANFVKEKNIPFVSAIYPNEGGVKENPFVIISNSTLKAHCEGIYDYILSNYSTSNVYLIKRKNDNLVDNLFKSMNQNGGQPLLKVKTIVMPDTASASFFYKALDTTKNMVIIGASLDQNFAIRLANALYPINKLKPLIFIGMPNWDGFKSLMNKNAYKDFPIRYTTPFYNVKQNDFTNILIKNYYNLYRSKPSDMAFKGFQTAYYFTSLLMEYGPMLNSHLNNDTLAPFHNYLFKPVFKTSTGIPDFFENKQLYMMQILNGEMIKE